MTAALEVRGLTRRFGGLVAVSDLAIDLHVGEVHAVIGTNGAGKSTLINMLAGEIPPSSGQIKLNGADVTSWSQHRRARAGIGRSYQRTTIFADLSVHENCRLAAQSARQRAWAFWEAATQCEQSNATATACLAAAGLSAHAHRPAGTLSHGGKRQLEVAMCLANQPKVLLLDEPLAGMGSEETQRMLHLLAHLKSGHAVLLVEHDMDAVFKIADRITVMVNGAVIATASPAAIRNNQDVQLAYLGHAGAQ